MAERIKLSNGKYCYSGADCSWHSANGINAARKEVRQAQEQLMNSTTFDELAAAKQRLESAQQQYDATDEGQQQLLKAQEAETDPIEKHALQKRRVEAELLANVRELESELQQATQDTQKVDITGWHNQPHSYKEPQFKVENQGTMYPATIGENYVPGDTTADIARKLRTEIKTAQKKGYLPEGPEYKVTHNAKNNHVDVTVRGLTDDQTTVPEETWGKAYTPEALTLRRRLSTIADSYKYDATNSQIDYFHVSHYSRVNIESERDKEWRLEEAARVKEQAQTAPLRKQLKAERRRTVSELGEYQLDFTNAANVLKSGEAYSPVKGHSSVVAVKDVDSDRVSFYNLVGKTGRNKKTGEQAPLGEVLSQYVRGNIRRWAI